jgi:hypothetical protein
MEYKLVDNGEEIIIIGKDSDGVAWFIPVHESNSMYQQYLIDTDGGLSLPELPKK